MTLSMNIGPSRIAPAVLARMADPPPPIDSPEALRTTAECLAAQRAVLGAGDGPALVMPGTGTMGMEAAAASFLAPGSPVTVVSTGYWGDRWADICRRAGLAVDVVAPRPGIAPDAATVDATMARRDSRGLFITHVDSSTGVLADIGALADVARRHDALVFVDGMASAGAEVTALARWGVDVHVTSTPKALGVPAGLVLVTMSARAGSLLEEREWTARTLALDLRPWVEPMRAAEAGEFRYWQSPAGNLLAALAEGLRLVLEEGRAARFERHAACRSLLHHGLEQLGIRILAEPDAVANGVTVCRYPPGWDSGLMDAVLERGVRLPAGSHPDLRDTTFRIGHLGNVTRSDIETTLDALEAVIMGVAPNADLAVQG